MIAGPATSRGAFLAVVLLGGLAADAAVGADRPTPVAELTDPIPIDSADEDDSDGNAPLVIASSPATAEHPLAPALRLARRSQSALEGIHDYEATLLKRERVGERLVEQTIHVKVREIPFSVYLKYGEPSAGREVLFVQGERGDKLWVHEPAGLTSLVGTVAADPSDPKALPESRYPITAIGMRKMLQRLVDQWTLESRYGEIDVKFYPNAKLRGRRCEVIESTHPRRRRQFPFQKTRLYLDPETRLPVRIEQYGFPGAIGDESPLEEFYEYGSLKTNIGLADSDFDRRNPRYAF